MLRPTLASFKARIAFASFLTLFSISALGACMTFYHYFQNKDQKGLGGPAELWAWREFVYWFFLALAVSLGVLVCQLGYERLLSKRKRFLLIILSLSLPIILPLFSILAYLPDFGWYLGGPEPNSLTRWLPMLTGIPILFLTNILRPGRSSNAVV